MPTIMVLAGPNGAGKTTFAGRWVSTEGKGFASLDADEIARRRRLTLTWA